MQRIRTAILGYGRSGSTMHADALEKNACFEVAAVSDVDAERRKQAAERFGCAVYGDYHQMLREERLNLVCIVNRSDLHSRMVCDCLGAGANVLVTKPWAVSAEEAERNAAAARASGKLLMPWLPARWGCDLRRLRELLVEGAIGNVFLVRRTVCGFATRSDWQTERRCGGGYLLNWGAHIIDPPVLLLGGKVRSVYGRLKQTINPGDAEDLFLAILNLDNGAVVQAEYTVAAEELPSWFVQGDRGTIVVHGNRLKVHRSTPKQPGDPTDFASMGAAGEDVGEETLEGNVYGDEAEIYGAVADARQGKGEFPVAPADALELSYIFDAIRLSSEENRVVEL